MKSAGVKGSAQVIARQADSKELGLGSRAVVVAAVDIDGKVEPRATVARFQQGEIIILVFKVFLATQTPHGGPA